MRDPVQSESEGPTTRRLGHLAWVFVILAALALWLVLRKPAAVPESPRVNPPEAASFEWPVPAGWKHETIPFPLDFAPMLPYHGIEELRFMPGFFKADAPDYWSYAFVWWLTDAPALDGPTLSAALAQYFRGLATAVGQDKYKFDPQRFRADLALTGSAAQRILSGDVSSYDPFVTGQELVLHVEASLRPCPQSGRNALLFLLSPKPTSDPVWAELRACAESWRCPH